MFYTSFKMVVPSKTSMVLLLVVISALVITNHKCLGIYGGNTAKSGQFPSTVSLKLVTSDLAYCTGSIIHKNWVLTSARLMANLLPEDLHVIAGTTSIFKGGTKFNVSKILVHPSYNSKTLLNDIALVKINGEFKFTDSVKSIEIGSVGVNESCTVAGWGDIENTNIVENLRFTHLKTISDEKCKEEAETGVRDFKGGPGQFCGFGGRGVGFCQGDYGSPLIANNKLVGVASYVLFPPCGAGWPDVYTRTSYYADWIKTSVEKY